MHSPMNGHVLQFVIHGRACLYCVLLEMEPSILNMSYSWLCLLLNTICIAELETSILNMRYSWLYLLMNTRCILEMETSAQGFGSLSKISAKTNGKSTFLILSTLGIAGLETFILNMSYFWLYLLMNTRCVAFFIHAYNT